MDRSELKIKSITPAELLGRLLNEVEAKYAPKTLYVSGSIEIPLRGIRVAVIGTRKPSNEGIEETKKIVEALVRKDIVIVSGLARGIDTVAHKTAIDSGGKTIAVLGTPLDRFYPKENRWLQELIMKEHLAISQFPIGSTIRPKNFVIRNRTMALISNASIIVEAGETSGVISQGWETIRLGRLLLINEKMKNLAWVQKMVEYGAILFSNVGDVIELIEENCSPLEVVPVF